METTLEIDVDGYLSWLDELAAADSVHDLVGALVERVAAHPTAGRDLLRYVAGLPLRPLELTAHPVTTGDLRNDADQGLLFTTITIDMLVGEPT